MNYLDTRLKDIKNGYIQHFGILGMKWGWTKDGKRTGAKEAMTEQERVNRLRDTYNKMMVREKKARDRVRGLYIKDPLHRTMNKLTFGFKAIGDIPGTLYNTYQYQKARKALGLKKGENAQKYLKKQAKKSL